MFSSLGSCVRCSFWEGAIITVHPAGDEDMNEFVFFFLLLCVSADEILVQFLPWCGC